MCLFFCFFCFLTFSAWHWFVGAVKQKGFLVGALGCLGDLKVYLCCCLRPLLEAFIGRNEESGATTGRWLTICIARSLLAPDEDSSTLLINTHHHQHREASILVQYSPQLSLLLVPFCFFSFREEKTGICRLYSLSRALASPGWRLSRVNCQSQVFPLLRDCLLGKNTFTFTRRGEVLPHCSSSSMRQVYHSRRCCRCIKKWKFKSTAHTIAFLGAILTMHIHWLSNSPPAWFFLFFFSTFNMLLNKAARFSFFPALCCELDLTFSMLF
jgi:hypothetical protein